VVAESTYQRFERFVADARTCVAALDLGLSGVAAPVADFGSFIETARPLVAGPFRAAVEILAPRVAALSPWLIEHDLLAVARRTYDEDAYTELLAWAIAPRTHAPTALRRQAAWLRSMGLPEPISPTQPRTQVGTDDGIPDLVLDYDSFTVVVEAKTGSGEHETPGSGSMQTVSYPEAVRRRLDLSANKPVHLVFLTPDRREAANDDAVLTTYVDFALAMADALREEDLNPDLRALFKLVITHFATCAVSAGVDAATLLQLGTWWIADGVLVDDGVLLSRLGDVQDLQRLFSLRHSR
jgi:hypothetical protein